ncbi:hypothetical protein D3C83_39050 [compost metagenome]
MDDLVERPDLGVPERGELGVLLAEFVGLAEALLDFGQAVRLQIVGSEFVDHGGPPLDSLGWTAPRRPRPETGG